MLYAYPVVLSHLPDGSPYPYMVTIPDFNSNTQGQDVPDAIFMARDASPCANCSMLASIHAHAQEEAEGFAYGCEGEELEECRENHLRRLCGPPGDRGPQSEIAQRESQ